MSRGFSRARLGRMRDVMAGHVGRGTLPGLVTLVSRGGETHAEAIGTTAVEGSEPMRRDTIFRIASMTKPVTAAAAMILVEECRVRLDDPVDRWLPELADRRVLSRPDGPLDDTAPARRPITLRDLLTFRLGIGAVMAPPGTYPIQQAIAEAGVGPGPDTTSFGPDEWMKRLGALPLVHQPGEAWMYHTGSDVLGVLIARVSGRSLEEFLRERIFEPLGMRDTGLHVPAAEAHRLPPAYAPDPESGKLKVADGGGTASKWMSRPAFMSGGGGLVSTADDFLAFFRMMLDGGRYGPGDERVLSRPSVELMTTDHLTPEEKRTAEAEIFFGDSWGWGFGLAVCTGRDDLSSVPGRFGWNGGRGTSGYADPAEDLVGVLMTQRAMESPEPPAVFRDFWTCAYQAVDS
jgi:CubicO group peptidase (beta-lactamase class C family)